MSDNDRKCAHTWIIRAPAQRYQQTCYSLRDAVSEAIFLANTKRWALQVRHWDETGTHRIVALIGPDERGSVHVTHLQLRHLAVAQLTQKEQHDA